MIRTTLSRQTTTLNERGPLNHDDLDAYVLTFVTLNERVVQSRTPTKKLALWLWPPTVPTDFLTTMLSVNDGRADASRMLEPRPQTPGTILIGIASIWAGH